MALCGIIPLRADEQITKLTNELKSYEASFRFHSERLIKTSPVGNVLSEDTVSPGRQKELDALKLVFESLKQQNNEVKEQLSLLLRDQSLSEHPPVANTLSVPIQRHHSKPTQKLIGDLLYQAVEFDRNIAVEMELAKFPTENALYHAEAKKYQQEDGRISNLEDTGDIKQEDLNNAKELFEKVAAKLLEQYNERLLNAEFCSKPLAQKVSKLSENALLKHNEMEMKIVTLPAVLRRRHLEQEQSTRRGRGIHH